MAERRRGLRVRFVDGREFAAKVLGTDPESDLALLKIDVPRGTRLAPAAFADSDRARVGDWVLAIGSPYGYNHTVTQGIVSAKHRVTELGKPYEDFLQTDASINPGNSGGALVNLRGELVGINAAIVSQSRGSEGIGLAISSKLAKSIVERLKRDGRVRRGFLGITPAELNQALVDKLANDGIRTVQDLLDEVGLDRPRGIWIEEVQPGSPAARAGIRRRDVVVEFNGAKVTGKSHLFFLVADTPPGQKVSVKYLRDRKENEVSVELAERSPVPLK
jgi:serine protease Do